MAAQVAASVIAQRRGVAPKVPRLFDDAEKDLLAHTRFPRDHWPTIPSTHPLERVNREIAHRSDVVGMYPNDGALIRIAAGSPVETDDEWPMAHRDISHASLQLILPELQQHDERPGPRRPASSPGNAGRRGKVRHMRRLDASSRLLRTVPQERPMPPTGFEPVLPP